ncbi:hypothetical protein X975_23185, partial [Stegodyphus mimosarum]
MYCLMVEMGILEAGYISHLVQDMHCSCLYLNSLKWMIAHPVVLVLWTEHHSLEDFKIHVQILLTEDVEILLLDIINKIL